MEDCLFCKIAAGKIPADTVFEDDEFLAFRDIDPQAPVHILVIPRRHVASLLELESTDDSVIAGLYRRAIDIARSEGLGERGFRTVINTGFEGGQSVFHIHLHLLGGRSLGWPPG